VHAYNDNFVKKKDNRLNIIDAGGNIGLTSLFFLENFDRPNIICVEPEIENFKSLELNIDNNSNCKVVKINGAVWSSNCKIKIINDFRDKLDWSCRVEETRDAAGIQAYSINQLIEDNNFKELDILKMDIEGSEKQVFTSPSSNLDFLKITKCIALEIHDEFDCRSDIYKVLNDFDFKLFNQGELTIGINQNLK
jgi:FkbM family methyltransferase